MGTVFDNEFAGLILKFSGSAGIDLTEKQAQLLSRHIQVMLVWNSRLNLTRVTGSEEIIVKHVLDSIVPAKFLPSSGYALDVGTGAGFPGIPLKIIYPDLHMVLLDSNRKKVSFLAAATAALGLKGTQALQGRWQDFSKAREQLNKFALITMRALKFEPQHIRSLASPVLAPGGLFACWGGIDADCMDKAADSSAEMINHCDMEFQGDSDYLLPGIKQRRAVRLWKKTSR
jgi:16S rRNA (guanine527-N7)-methyltransferase